MAKRLLGKLKKGQRGKIVSVGNHDSQSHPCTCRRITERLMEMGLVEGSHVEILHEAPLGGDPVAVRVRGALVGLRRNEANHIEIEEFVG